MTLNLSLQPLVLFVLLSACKRLVPYHPIERAPTGGRSASPSSPGPAEREALVQVLSCYGVDRQVEGDGTVPIPKRLTQDEDLLASHTSMSRDAAWLAEPLPQLLYYADKQHR